MNRVRRNWTAKEDSTLREIVKIELYNNRPLLWRELAKQIPGRSNKDCRKRWWNSLAGGTVKGAWTPEEDRRLADAVAKYGSNWAKIAAFVGSRCGDQCSSHWRQVLNPSINYCDWTEEEDEQLLQAVRMHGTNWSTIATFHTPQRTTLALKNRYWKLRALLTKSSKQVTTTSRSSGDDDSNDDDGEDDDDEEDDEDVVVGEKLDGQEQNAVRPDALGQSPLGNDGWIGRSATQRKLNPLKSPHAWSGYHKAPASTATPRAEAPHAATDESWLGDLANPPAEHGAGTVGLYSDGGLFDMAGVGDDEAMRFDFSMLSEPPMALEAHQALKGSHLLPLAIEPPVVDGSPKLDPITPQSMGSRSEPIPIDPALGRSGPEPGLHRVSITLSCSTGELGNVMSLIAGTGLNVSIKVDTK